MNKLAKKYETVILSDNDDSNTKITLYKGIRDDNKYMNAYYIGMLCEFLNYLVFTGYKCNGFQSMEQEFSNRQDLSKYVLIIDPMLNDTKRCHIEIDLINSTQNICIQCSNIYCNFAVSDNMSDRVFIVNKLKFISFIHILNEMNRNSMDYVILNTQLMIKSIDLAQMIYSCIKILQKIKIPSADTYKTPNIGKQNYNIL